MFMIYNIQKHRPNGAAAEGGTCVSDYVIRHRALGTSGVSIISRRRRLSSYSVDLGLDLDLVLDS